MKMCNKRPVTRFSLFLVWGLVIANLTNGYSVGSEQMVQWNPQRNQFQSGSRQMGHQSFNMNRMNQPQNNRISFNEGSRNQRSLSNMNWMNVGRNLHGFQQPHRMGNVNSNPYPYQMRNSNGLSRYSQMNNYNGNSPFNNMRNSNGLQPSNLMRSDGNRFSQFEHNRMGRSSGIGLHQGFSQHNDNISHSYHQSPNQSNPSLTKHIDRSWPTPESSSYTNYLLNKESSANSTPVRSSDMVKRKNVIVYTTPPANYETRADPSFQSKTLDSLRSAPQSLKTKSTIPDCAAL